MNFNIRMGIPEMQELWLDLQEKYRSGNIKKKEEQLYKKWGKALKLLSADPGYPSLQTHGIVFVNGIPVVVLEFKSAVQENTTIMDAYKQLTIRYRRDIPEIFKYNAFVVISDGANNKYGSFFSPYDFFYAWRKINSDDKELDGINSLVTMVKGLFRKDRLLEVIKDFIYFPDNSDKDLKIVCRYPQFFAANKLYENIKAHLRPEGDGKGGTYFGATGCGKSYTMLFLTRMLMKSKYLQPFHPRYISLNLQTVWKAGRQGLFCP